jgi:hypothetical protein
MPFSAVESSAGIATFSSFPQEKPVQELSALHLSMQLFMVAALTLLLVTSADESLPQDTE